MQKKIIRCSNFQRAFDVSIYVDRFGLCYSTHGVYYRPWKTAKKVLRRLKSNNINYTDQISRYIFILKFVFRRMRSQFCFPPFCLNTLFAFRSVVWWNFQLFMVVFLVCVCSCYLFSDLEYLFADVSRTISLQPFLRQNEARIQKWLPSSK